MATMLPMRLDQLTENKFKVNDQCLFIELHSIQINQGVKSTIQLQMFISSSELFNLIHQIIFFTM